MHCSSCSAIIQRALHKSKGIITSSVNVTNNRGTIEFNSEEISEEEILGIIIKKGYGAKIALGTFDYEEEERKKEKILQEIKRNFYWSFF